MVAGVARRGPGLGATFVFDETVPDLAARADQPPECRPNPSPCEAEFGTRSSGAPIRTSGLCPAPIGPTRLCRVGPHRAPHRGCECLASPPPPSTPGEVLPRACLAGRGGAVAARGPSEGTHRRLPGPLRQRAREVDRGRGGARRRRPAPRLPLGPPREALAHRGAGRGLADGAVDMGGALWGVSACAIRRQAHGELERSARSDTRVDKEAHIGGGGLTRGFNSRLVLQRPG